MKKIKSHFWYSKNQRNGILFLMLLICVLQIIYHLIEVQSDITIENKVASSFQKKIDSLKKGEIEKKKFKIRPFNPNYISDYKGYQIGMSIQEIDRLHAYRKEGLFVNSESQFQKVTQVSDSLLKKISPFFKFPKWDNKKYANNKKDRKKLEFNHEIQKNQSEISTTDLNRATQSDFLVVDGVTEAMAERIVKYRKKLQGYSVNDQLYEVWGLNESLVSKLLQIFSVQQKVEIQKININTASFKQVLSIPYIEYDLCVKIFEFRDEVAELQSISELKNMEGFPLEKYDRIVLYLYAE